MKLTDDECVQILKSKKDPFLDKAIRHEQKVRLHMETTIDETDNPAYIDFLSGVGDIIPDDTYERFKSLIKWPFVTVDYNEGVFSSFQKIFEAPDRNLNVVFNSPDYDKDFDPYKKSVFEWLVGSGISNLKTKFNSFVVVDVPSVQLGDRPEPYFYILPITNVLKVEVNRKNLCEYIAFDTKKTFGENGDRLIAFFDDDYYRIFIEKDDNYYLHSDGNGFQSKSFHGIGMCPSRSFWSDVIDPTETMINKKMPATNSIGSLDTLAFRMLSKEYSDLFNLYPILWTLPEEENEDNLNDNVFDNDLECESESLIKRQKSLSDKWLSTPARVIQKPAPNKEDGDVGEVAGFIQPKVDNLKFIASDLEDRKKSIAASISGKKPEPINDQAKNEKQISSGVEDEYAVSLNVAHNFAELEEWMLKIGAYIIFGKDSVKNISVNSGKNFFLQSHNEIMGEMEVMNKIGAPTYIIDQQEKAYVSTKYRSNPEAKERMEIIRLLMPYRHFKDNEVLTMASHLDVDKVEIRLNFTDILDEFETSFSPVESFGKDGDSMGEEISLKDRISVINKEFLNIIKRNNYGSIGNFEKSIRGSDGGETSPPS
jgi:hypothetical protein